MSEKRKNTKIKICGVRRKEDLVEIIRSGVDAVGYNFVPSSKRFIGAVSMNKTTEWISQVLPRNRVGVFANCRIDDIFKVVSINSLNIVQLHGEESLEFILGLRQKLSPKLKIWKAVRIFFEEDLAVVNRYNQAAEVDGVLLDAKVSGGPLGGTGVTFDWSLVSRIPRLKPLILAGGLTPENVADAIRQTNPDWVDVAGGVETTPEVKDPQKIRAFVAAVRRATRPD
jgi:phosphoribosylanthranilate isomerase